MMKAKSGTGTARVPVAPASSRRSRRSAEMRERLFRAALELFARKGLQETTVEDITEAADVGKGTFFNYFPSKEHILIAFVEMQIGKLEAAVEEAQRTELPMPDFLREMSVRMTEEPGRNPSVVRALLQAYLSKTPVRELIRAKQQRGHELMAEMIEMGQQRGEVRGDLPAGRITHVLRQTIFGTLLLWSVTGEGALGERIRSAFDLLWTGLSPRVADGGKPKGSERGEAG
jgi:AcrR family transcriptional regulator